MLISWIKQFVRVSGRGKFYTIVNTLGLAFGLACTMIILLWADFQKSYDKFHSEYQKIFQVYEIQSYANGYKLYTYSTPGTLSGFLKEKFPEINSSARFAHNSAVIGMGEKAFRDSELGFTDSTFFRIFKIEFISGNKNECLRDLNSIVLTEKLAKKIFNTTDVIGRSIRLNGVVELNVTAVIKDYPKNANIQFSSLIQFEKLKDFGVRGINSWGWNSHSTFVKLNNTDKIGELEKNMNLEIEKMNISSTTKFHLYPIEKVRLYNPDPNDFSLILLLTILVSVAGFVLILACINFINLITARAANRAKEVGIRKVIGSSRTQLVMQYFLESFLSTIISLIIAILLVDFFLPTFNSTLGTELVMSFSNFQFWYKILLVVLAVGIISGIYPALVLSSFQPSKVLKGLLRSGAKGAGFRKTMVIVQYTITIFLVVVSIFMFKQLNFISNVDTGMNRNNIIFMPFRKEMEPKYNSFKDELSKIPSIKYVTGSQNLPFKIYSSTSSISWDGKDTTQVYLFTNTVADEFFTDAFEIKMADGRFFSSSFPSDTMSVVINETAAKIIDKKQILNETLRIWGYNLKVIGVMKDFHFEHFSGKIKPLFILYGQKNLSNVIIKAEQSFDGATMDKIRTIFSDFYPEFPFESTILDDEYYNMFSIEKQLKSILGQFTVLAILISCIGLLSLAAFIAEQQRKSLVLRKIHGASMFKIIGILLGSFTKWVLISGIIAIPLSYIALNGMFSNYAFHTDFSWWIFAGALVAALIIAIITVLYQALKTARINPVEILRYE
ncbi:MAG: FtsX-like permease family protein [Bacteroidales bacterium]|nr:FtsX-like permease family protein [Bacteroidales bacterium]